MKYNGTIKIVLTLLLFLTLRQAGAQGNLIVNGSFEDGFNGWNFQGQSYIPGVNIASDSNAKDYANFYRGGNHINQTIQTISGTYYSFSFSAIEFQSTNDVKIFADNSLLATLNFKATMLVTTSGSPYNGNWEDFSYVFEAESTSTTINLTYITQAVIIPFGNTYDYYYGTGGIDNVSVVQVVPEPSLVALFGLGLAGWLAGRRRLKP